MNELGHVVACLDKAEAFDGFQLPQCDIVDPIALHGIVTATAGWHDCFEGFLEVEHRLGHSFDLAQRPGAFFGGNVNVCAAIVVGVKTSNLLDYLPMVADLIPPSATGAEIEYGGDHFKRIFAHGQLK